MKKSISILILLALVAAGAFAQGFSIAVGGGGIFDLSAGNGMITDTSDYPSGVKVTASSRNMSFGGFVFFDASYAELDVNFTYGLLKATSDESGSTDIDTSALQLGFGLKGKYPIDLGGLTVFPLLGVDYNLVLSTYYEGEKVEDSDNYKSSEQGQLGFLAGAGLDFPFSDSLFLRAEAMFHLRLPSKAASDGVDAMKDTYDKYNMDAASANATFGMGARVKIGVGFKF